MGLYSLSNPSSIFIVRGYNPEDNATIPVEPEVTTEPQQQVTTAGTPVTTDKKEEEEGENNFFIEDVALLPIIGVILVVFIAVIAGCFYQIHKTRKNHVSLYHYFKIFSSPFLPL